MGVMVGFNVSSFNVVIVKVKCYVFGWYFFIYLIDMIGDIKFKVSYK